MANRWIGAVLFARFFWSIERFLTAILPFVTTKKVKRKHRKICACVWDWCKNGGEKSNVYKHFKIK